MDLNLLIDNWESSGLLEGGLTIIQKSFMAMKFDMLAKHLVRLSDQPDYRDKYGKIEMLIFPTLRRICLEKDEMGNEYNMHYGVNPIRLLNEFTTWFNSSETQNLIEDLSYHSGIDIEAELVAVYSETQRYRFINDNYINHNMEPIIPMKFIPPHKL